MKAKGALGESMSLFSAKIVRQKQYVIRTNLNGAVTAIGFD